MTWRAWACFTVVFVLACSSVVHAATYKGVLGRTEIERIVKAEVKLINEISIHEDFITWSVNSIEPMASPSNRDESRELLARGYHAFVVGVVSFAKRQNMKFINIETGRQFLKANTDCGPIPCDEDVCCDFCQKPC